MKRPQILDKFLSSPNNELEGLITHAKRLRRLQGQYQQAVPENLAKNCHVANFQQGQLTLCCQSSAWAMRLRLEKDQLLATLKSVSTFRSIDNIQVITQPASQPIEKKENIDKIPMSPESARAISQMADSMNDPRLRDSLMRLARRKND